jgi:hypothetical protein
VTVPKDAYVTFVNEDSYDVVHSLIGEKKDLRSIAGHQIDIEEANEPSNIEYQFLYCEKKKWRLCK